MQNADSSFKWGSQKVEGGAISSKVDFKFQSRVPITIILSITNLVKWSMMEKNIY